MPWTEIVAIFSLVFIILIFIIALAPYVHSLWRYLFTKSQYSKLGNSSKIRLVHQVREAVFNLSKAQVGAIITIENHDLIDNLRTDGVILDANISSSLIISLFNKNSPLHDGAIVIRDNKIVYAATYYKISRKSLDNRFGARHRAAMGISEVSDAVTIVISEETGGISITKNGILTKVETDNFQESLVMLLKE